MDVTMGLFFIDGSIRVYLTLSLARVTGLVDEEGHAIIDGLSCPLILQRESLSRSF